MARGRGGGARKDEIAARPVPVRVTPADQWPANEIEKWPAEKLSPHPDNVRKHPVGQLIAVDESYADHGMVRPLVVNDRGQILAGHAGAMTIEHLHGKGVMVPVVVVRGWTLEQERAFMLRDNLTAAGGGYDRPRMGLQLADLRRGAYPDLTKLGLKSADIRRLVPTPPRAAGEPDPDAIAEAPPAVVSQPGDVWLMGDHRLMCGDATNADHVATLYGADRPRLMATDPPYGVRYDPTWRDAAGAAGADSLARSAGGRAAGEVRNDHRSDWRDAFALFPGEVAYVWHSALFGPEVCQQLEACGFERRSHLVWRKHQAVIGQSHFHWQHEACWYMVRKGAAGGWQGSRSETTVWDIAGNSGHGGKKNQEDAITGHGTQKPLECFTRAIRNSSAPGDFIYDGFVGSGTMLIAAEPLGRRGLALEIDPGYCDVTVLRWEGFSKKTAILAATGEGRAATAARRGIVLTAPAGVGGEAPASVPAAIAAAVRVKFS